MALVLGVVGFAAAKYCYDRLRENVARARYYSLPSSYAKEKNLAIFASENDKTERRADVYLLTRPLRERNDHKTELRHWSLLFKFKNGTCRIIEAAQTDAGLLMAFYFKYRPQGEFQVIRLGTVKTSPFILLENCRKDEFNGKSYSLVTEDNCQGWVKKFLKELRFFDILDSLNEKAKTLREASPEAAFVANLVNSLSPARDSFD